jgi:hypothetical protein
MELDLRKDAADFRAELVKKVRAYAARAAKSPKVPAVSAVEIGYEFAQLGWILVHFDTRPKHDRDGEWTVFEEKDLLLRPKWYQVVEALDGFDEEGEQDLKGRVVLVTVAGKKIDGAKLSEEDFSGALGAMLKHVLLECRGEGLFAQLPKSARCQLDIEEFNGTWAWPEYEKLGKVNVI